MVMPGDNVTMEVELITPIAMDPELRFAIREGKRTGTVGGARRRQGRGQMVEKFRETRVFLEECWEELEKVTWPDREQLQSATIVIILFNINGELLHRSRAMVSVFDSGYILGDGVWEGLRMHNGTIFQLDRHPSCGCARKRQDRSIR